MKPIAATTITAALILGSGAAHADQGITNDTEICAALGALNGDPSHDVTILTTLATLYANYSGMSLEAAGRYIGQTAHNHCPQYWPKIQAAISYAIPGN